MELASVETGIGNNLKTKKGRVCSRLIEGHWKINENQGKWKPDRISIGRNRNRESFENKGDSVAERLKVIEKSMSIKESGSQIELASVETGIRFHLRTRAIL